MKLIMRDPDAAKIYGKRQEYRRSQSTKVSPNKDSSSYLNVDGIGNSELGDVLFKKPISNRISRKGSGDSTE